MSEFSIIQEYCQGLGVTHSETKLSVGDDAAVIQIPEGQELAISVDTMVAGVHFPTDTSAAHIAHKLLAVNLSDMAAMGAKAKWATIALTLPESNTDWLASFSKSLNDLAQQYNVEIIGGDTTQGPLCLSLQIMGLLPAGQKLTRCGALVGDDVYVTHTLGDAALGLQFLLDPSFSYQLDKTPLMAALNSPVPRTELGVKLLSVANSCIDVSDGILADLGHIADRSQVDLNINVEQIPLSIEYQQYIEQGGNHAYALIGGDDYELAFTAPQGKRQEIAELAIKHDVAITRIGDVSKASDKPRVNAHLNNQPYQPQKKGFEHFS